MTSNHENGVSQVEEDEIFVRPGSFRLALDDQSVDVPIEKLVGIGKKTGERLRNKGIETAVDLLLMFPRRYKHFDPDKGALAAFEDRDNPVAIIGTVKRVKAPPPRTRAPVEVLVESDGVRFSLIWFNMNKKWFTSKFKVDSEIAFWGDVSWEKTPPQLAHANHTFSIDEIERGIEPTYPMVDGLNAKALRKAQRDAWDKIAPHLIEIVPATLREQYGLVGVRDALETIHGFRVVEEIEAFQADLLVARERLIYEECFTLQQALAKIYISERRVADAPKLSKEQGARDFISSLPFELTGDQKRVFEEILVETGSGVRMRRLLQGDVGSGKTVVALACAELARENGFQSALMVPSEVLAQQHFRTASQFLSETNCKVALLTGSLGAAERRETLRLMRGGHLDLVIGTHALFQDDVEFSNLGLVVIDEQHKFGVEQRKRLEAKGAAPHLLAATATPIPRSLAHALFGDLNLTYLKEKPPGRQPIRTFVRDPGRSDKVYEYVAKQCHEGTRAFVVFPSIDPIEGQSSGLLEGSEQLAQDHFEGLRVGVCHGRMGAEDREEVMTRFREGDLDVLCATTVIEVGVDVPEATLMVIDGAERFGLSQLHQLRGRVGRGEEASMCILIVRNSSDTTKTRTDAFEKTDDGFELADIDLQIRGGGEFLGQRQSGSGEFRVANLIRDADVLMQARNDARSLLFGGV